MRLEQFMVFSPDFLKRGDNLMRIAIHQPNYIPWCGFFAKMKACDIFVFLDDAEISTRQSYVYRSKIIDKNLNPDDQKDLVDETLNKIRTVQ